MPLSLATLRLVGSGSNRGKSGSGQLGAPAAALNLMQKFPISQNFAAGKLWRWENLSKRISLVFFERVSHASSSSRVCLLLQIATAGKLELSVE